MDREATAELLIKNGADVNAKDTYGWTALHRTSSMGKRIMVELLIESGADIKATTHCGWTPFLCAKYNNHPLIAKLLKNALKKKTEQEEQTNTTQ